MSDNPTPKRRVDFLVPPEETPTTCEGCGAPIVFTRHPSTRNRMVLSLRTVEVRDGQRYALSHFADCPEAKRFKRRDRRG